MTSEHLGTTGAWCSWCPAALCQWVTADHQLQDVPSLRQEWYRQTAVKVPSANMVDLQETVKGLQASKLSWSVNAHSVDIDTLLQEAI